MKTIRLANGNVVTDSAVVKRDIIVRDMIISFDQSEVRCDQTIDITGKYVVPGFIDIHFHGYNLFEFTVGYYDAKRKTFDNSKSAYDAGFTMLRKALAGFGVTGLYVGTWAAPIKTLKTCYGRLADYLTKQEKDTCGAKILGSLLEGTFINSQMSGAQPLDSIYEPSIEVFDQINEGGTIKLANVAPEFGDKSLRLMEYLTKKGIVVGAGHSKATGDEIAAAINSGLKYYIHFLNGPTGNSYKLFEGGGAVEAVLQSDELYAEQITDGYHINPAYVRAVIQRKGIDKVIAVTDALYAAGSDLKHAQIGGTAGQVSDDGNYIYVVGKPNTLCSSTLTMDRAFGNLLNWLTSDIPGIWQRLHSAHTFEESLVMAAKACSTSPAELMGLSKQGYGKIADGAAADMCIVNIKGYSGGYKVAIEKTIVGGNIVYSKA
jgi:N-acetylglucosamine-6-phosphate deacetylase